jgi:hypothetical protein
MWSARAPVGTRMGRAEQQPERPQMPSTHVEYVAHHWLLLAGPAFLPAVVVVAVVLYIAIKDRRAPDDDEQSATVDTSEETRD